MNQITPQEVPALHQASRVSSDRPRTICAQSWRQRGYDAPKPTATAPRKEPRRGVRVRQASCGKIEFAKRTHRCPSMDREEESRVATGRAMFISAVNFDAVLGAKYVESDKRFLRNVDGYEHGCVSSFNRDTIGPLDLRVNA